MTQPANQVSMLVQAFTIVYVGINRIRDFLLLPEMKSAVVEKPEDNKLLVFCNFFLLIYRIALRIINGEFKWAEGEDLMLTKDQKKEKDKKEEILKRVENRRLNPSEYGNKFEKMESRVDDKVSHSDSVTNEPRPVVQGKEGSSVFDSPIFKSPSPSLSSSNGKFCFLLKFW
jgi:hypothetical protein